MTTPFEDQVEAAKKEVREKIHAAFGIPADHVAHKTSNPFLEEIFAAHVDDEKCEHLLETPVQPWHWTALTKWACVPCVSAAWAWRKKLGPNHPTMGVIEELTCDRCRRYCPSGLRPALLRIDFFTMTLGCCKKCHLAFKENGGVDVQPT